MNVLLYVMDSVRADHVSALGYPRPTTPVLDRLAEEGVCFTQAYAQGGWTLPSAAALLHGVLPTQAGIRRMHDRPRADLPNLAENFTRQGRQTVAFTTMYQTGKQLGFHRGFQQFHELFRDRELIRSARLQQATQRGNDYCLPLSEDLHSRALGWIDRRLMRWRRPGAKPFFMFLWSIDVHEPYRHPDSFNLDAQLSGGFTAQQRRRPFSWVRSVEDCRRLTALYDGAVRYQDAQLGVLLEGLRTRDLLDETLVVVLADHGEMFFEHGLPGHGKYPWEAQQRIPLVMRCPQLLPQGLRCRALVETRDVAPTILDYAGLEAEPRFQGKSLRPVIEGDVSEIHDALHLDIPMPFCEQEQARVTITREWKLIDYRPPRFGLRFKRFVKHWARFLQSRLRPLWRSWFETQGSPHRGGPGTQWSAAWRSLFDDRPGLKLFRRDADAAERHDLAAERPEIVAELRALRPASEEVAPPSRPALPRDCGKRKVDRQLAELGYIES